MTSPTWSLTSHLLSLSPDCYKDATQSSFLLAAAEGRLSKTDLGTWLANDRLYIHAYIRAAGTLIAALDLPPAVPGAEAPETQLVDWLVEALAGARREERMFIDVAARYGLRVDLVAPPGGAAAAVAPESKLPGLRMVEDLFRSVGRSEASAVGTLLLPWLEGAVTFWATEKCYLDAWSWARSHQPVATGAPEGRDDDGGAMRKEFIPNWSSPEFAGFVARLAGIIDSAVAKVLEVHGDGAKEGFLNRVEGKWKTLLTAEAAFWPDLE